ncbi:ATP-dependent RNA helicase SrmB [Glaciecola sp. SC05]|uniref:ATP-dependent RNA helicase SrmB n=1 Tax=Glaciecola sp. SC05 TaxID=1987355 RepID=UPI0035279E1A
MFAELELDDELCRAVAEMGFAQPTSVQSLVIPDAMEGHDILACAPTGTGKTAAFLLPICQYLLDNPKRTEGSTRALVLVPTRELANQVGEQARAIMKYTDLTCGVITGGINYGTDKALLGSRPDLLIATPGRLFEHIEKEDCDCRDIESLVLDEADRMLDMGFSSIVYQIAGEARWRKQSMLFSATLSSHGVRNFAAELLKDPIEINAVSSRKEKAKTLQWYHLCDDLTHKEALLEHYLSNNVESCIVFVKTRERLHLLKDKLANKYQMVYLQGEMPQDKRNEALAKFKSGDAKILLCTDVAARGIDVPNVSHVINFDMPRGADVYLHRIGRTGRAGAKGTAVSLIEAHDYIWVGKIERYTKESFKPRVIDGLKPKNKAPKLVKKSKPKSKGKRKNKALGTNKRKKK